MKMKYTKRQIQEAIRYWKGKLAESMYESSDKKGSVNIVGAFLNNLCAAIKACPGVENAWFRAA